jgi:hypothetical protein
LSSMQKTIIKINNKKAKGVLNCRTSTITASGTLQQQHQVEHTNYIKWNTSTTLNGTHQH